MIRREEKPVAFRAALWEAHSKRCFYCSELLQFADMQIDHIIPVRLLENPEQLAKTLQTFGLPTTFDLENVLNLVPTHARCNRTKSGTLFDQGPALFFIERSKAKNALFTTLLNRYAAQERIDVATIRAELQLSAGSSDYQELISSLEKVRRRTTATIDSPLQVDGKTYAGDVERAALAPLLDVPFESDGPFPEGLRLCAPSESSDPSDLGIAGHVTVKTLREFLRAEAAGYFAFTTIEQKVAASYRAAASLIVVGLAALPAEESFISSPRIGVVDLDLLPDSLIRFWDDAAYANPMPPMASIQACVNEGYAVIRSVSHSHIWVECQSVGFYIRELMRGNFDGDGQEELLVSRYSHAIGGSMGHGDVLILKRRNAEAKFEVSVLPEYDDPGVQSMRDLARKLDAERKARAEAWSKYEVASNATLLALKQGDKESLQKALSDRIRCLEGLSQEDQRFQEAQCDTELLRSQVAAQLNNTDEIVRAAKAAGAIAQQHLSSEDESLQWLYRFGEAKARLATAYLVRRDHPEAERSAIEAVEVAARIARKHPDAPIWRSVHAQYRLIAARARQATENFGLAADDARIALEIAKGLPPDRGYFPLAATASIVLARLAFRAKSFEECQTYALDGVSHVPPMTGDRAASEATYLLVELYHLAGSAAARRALVEQSAKYFQQVVEVGKDEAPMSEHVWKYVEYARSKLSSSKAPTDVSGDPASGPDSDPKVSKDGS